MTTMTPPSRTTRVRCDQCGTDHHLTVGADTRLTENQWDWQLVRFMRRLGWKCGMEPKASHHRIPPDICPDCTGREPA